MCVPTFILRCILCSFHLRIHCNLYSDLCIKYINFIVNYRFSLVHRTLLNYYYYYVYYYSLIVCIKKICREINNKIFSFIEVTTFTGNLQEQFQLVNSLFKIVLLKNSYNRALSIFHNYDSLWCEMKMKTYILQIRKWQKVKNKKQRQFFAAILVTFFLYFLIHLLRYASAVQ